VRRWAWGAIVLVLSPFLRAAVEPTEAGLLEAWEAAQRRDPKTAVFEKTGDRVYRFKTERFPYDGKIQILNLSVTDYGAGVGEEGLGGVIGAVELELEGVTEEFQRKFATSYSAWDQGNRFFFNKDEGRWLTVQENFARWQSQTLTTAPSPWRRFFSPRYFVAGCLLTVSLVAFWIVSRRQLRPVLALAEESRRIQREAIALARESLEEQRKTLALLEQIRDGLRR
jgi:hypothetical protein